VIDSYCLPNHTELLLYGKYNDELIGKNFLNALPKIAWIEGKHFVLFAKIVGEEILTCIWLIDDEAKGKQLLERFRDSVSAEAKDDIDEDELASYFYAKIGQYSSDPIEAALSKIALTDCPDYLFNELQTVQRIVFYSDYSLELLIKSHFGYSTGGLLHNNIASRAVRWVLQDVLLARGGVTE